MMKMSVETCLSCYIEAVLKYIVRFVCVVINFVSHCFIKFI